MTVIAELKDASLAYHNKTIWALRNVNLQISSTGITALLGPSASGKTSALSLLLGLCTPTSGRVKVHFETVGYMPQSYSLHEYFTVSEIFRFYGTVYGLDRSTVTSRSDQIIRTFDLDPDVIIGTCSGGTKRRISLGCSVIHRPDLTILDEPTAGVDPILRVKIWKFLRELSIERSVLITTHGIHEAQNADFVAFLRRGRIIETGSPLDIIQRDETSTNLQDALFRKCLEDEIEENVEIRITKIEDDDNDDNKTTTTTTTTFRKFDRWKQQQQQIFRALCIKNLLVLKRHTAFMVFQMLLPIFTLLIFLVSVGRSPKGIKVALINEDIAPDWNCSNHVISCPTTKMLGTSSTTKFSCLILERLLIDNDVIRFQSFQRLQDAKMSVIRGRSIAVFHFKIGFSENLLERMNDLMTMSTDDSKELIDVEVTIDGTSQILVSELKRRLAIGVETTLTDYLRQCVGLNSSRLYGLRFLRHDNNNNDDNNDITYSMLPAMATLVVHFMAMALTADLTASEKEAGLRIREKVAGIPFPLVALSQILTQFSVIGSLQVLFAVVFLIVTVNPRLEIATASVVVILLIAQSLCGMTAGVLLSSAGRTRDQVIQMGVAVVFPAFLLSGVMWPLQSLPTPLKIGYALPVTFPAGVIRSLVRSNEIAATASILGSLLIPIIWILVLSIFATWLTDKTS